MTKKSQESLVARLREIERMSPTTEVDKTKEYKKVFEEFRESNSLVERVIKGETTFSAETERAIQTFVGDPFLPHYVTSEHVANFQELIEVSGYPYPSNSLNLFGNPIGGSIAFGGLIYIATRIATEQAKEKMSRRDFLLGRVVIPALGLAVGGVGGSSGSLIRKNIIDTTRENAAYADSMVQQLYRK